MEDSILYSESDGLLLPEIGSWAIKKYSLVYEYNCLFSTGMKNKWETRVYIDLFSGPGKAIIKKQNKIVNTSALLSLLVKDKFDKYIFCDVSAENIEVLRKRVSTIHDKDNITYLVGDSNLLINEILKNIPKYSKSNKVLSFCFVDPFSLNIHFNTIKKLSNYYVDFLVLLALGMDANRNFYSEYIKNNSDRIDNFLGLNDWRNRWEQAYARGESEIRFLAEEYNNQMISLGYLQKPIENFIPIIYDEKNILLYYLAFFSKHSTGFKFWKNVHERNIDPSFFD